MNIFNKDFFKDNSGVSVNVEKSKKNTGKKILSISLAFAIGVGAGFSLTTSYNEILKSKDLLNNESASISQNEVMHVSLEDINSLNIIINDSDCSNTFFSEVCKHLQEDGLNFKITSDDMNIDSENAVVITLDQQYLAGPGVMVIAPYENNNTNNSDALALALDAGFDENGFNMEDICCGIAGYKETETGVSTRVPTSSEEKVYKESSFATVTFGVTNANPKLVASSIESGLARYYSYTNDYDGGYYLDNDGNMVPYDLIYRIEASDDLDDVKEKIKDDKIEVKPGVLENQVVINSIVEDTTMFNKLAPINLYVEKTKWY